MKRLIDIVDGEGFNKLIGERITVFCTVYIYTGKLIGVNDTCILLENPSIVYETGSFTDSRWKDAQALPGPWYVQTASIESFGVLK